MFYCANNDCREEKKRAKKNHVEVARIVSHNAYGIYAQRREVTAIATKLCHRIDS